MEKLQNRLFLKFLVEVVMSFGGSCGISCHSDVAAGWLWRCGLLRGKRGTHGTGLGQVAPQLVHATLSHTDLSHSTLSHTSLSRTQLFHTQLCYLQLSLTHLLRTIFANSDVECILLAKHSNYTRQEWVGERTRERIEKKLSPKSMLDEISWQIATTVQKIAHAHTELFHAICLPLYPSSFLPFPSIFTSLLCLLEEVDMCVFRSFLPLCPNHCRLWHGGARQGVECHVECRVWSAKWGV